jgi:hypothetical protein
MMRLGALSLGKMTFLVKMSTYCSTSAQEAFPF